MLEIRKQIKFRSHIERIYLHIVPNRNISTWVCIQLNERSIHIIKKFSNRNIRYVFLECVALPPEYLSIGLIANIILKHFIHPNPSILLTDFRVLVAVMRISLTACSLLRPFRFVLSSKRSSKPLLGYSLSSLMRSFWSRIKSRA